MEAWANGLVWRDMFESGGEAAGHPVIDKVPTDSASAAALSFVAHPCAMAEWVAACVEARKTHTSAARLGRTPTVAADVVACEKRRLEPDTLISAIRHY